MKETTESLVILDLEKGIPNHIKPTHMSKQMKCWQIACGMIQVMGTIGTIPFLFECNNDDTAVLTSSIACLQCVSMFDGLSRIYHATTRNNRPMKIS